MSTKIFWFFVRAQPCKAKLEVVRAMGPGEIVLDLVAPPRVRPWPISVVHVSRLYGLLISIPGILSMVLALEDRRRIESRQAPSKGRCWQW